MAAGSELLKSVADSGKLEPDVASGLQDVASDIDALLGRHGHVLIQESTPAGALVALSLTITKALREALKGAEAEFAVPLAALTEEGFRAAMSGWLPPQALKRKSRTAQQKAAKASERAVLQLKVDEALRNEVQRQLPALSKRAGYPVTLSSIALGWIADQLGVDRPSTDTHDRLQLVVRREFLNHVLAVADERGVTLERVVDEGVRDLLAGSWTPQLTGWNVVSERPRSTGGTWTLAAAEPVDRTKVVVALREDLLEGLRVRAEEMNEEAVVPVHPGTIVIALLKDRLGEPAE